jgi:hypothetical protein
MSVFKAINLLQAVEAQTILGAALQNALTASPSDEAGFGALLSTRHMARRMAGNPITMTAINSSEIAIKIVFENTSEYNFRPIEEIAKNSIAMLRASTTLASLNAVTANATGFKYFSESSFYEANILNTLATLIGDDPANYATLGSFILDPTPFGQVVTSVKAMTALVQSSDAMQIVVDNAAPMADIAANTSAITITAHSDIAVTKISNSTTALDQVTDDARTIVTSVPSALAILGANHTAWTYILAGSTILDVNIYGLLMSFGKLNPDVHTSVADIFADATASEAIATSHPAIMALVSESNKAKYPGTSALDTLISSDNLGTVLASSIAIDHIVAEEDVMNILIANDTAFPILLASGAAKSAIFVSPTLVSTMMTTGSASLAAVQGLAQSATVVNDASIGTFKTVGVPGNIIILTGVMGSIVATTLANTFKGDTQAESTFAIPGTSLSSGPIDINLPFTNAVWDIASIAATAAGNVNITYVDFN